MLAPIVKGSIQDVTFDFINYFYGDKIDAEGKKAVFLAFRSLLNNGWTLIEIYNTLNNHIKTFVLPNVGGYELHVDNAGADVERVFLGKSPRETNLLKSGDFYYHNQLRVFPDGTCVDFDYDTGMIVTNEPKFFLEMRASYTIDDLVNYFLSRKGMYDERLLIDTSRIYGGMNWIKKRYNDDIEIMLYMIDAAYNAVVGKNLPKIDKPIDVHDFFSDAMAMKNFKKEECATNGTKGIIPRERLLSNRSGLLDKQRKQAIL